MLFFCLFLTSCHKQKSKEESLSETSAALTLAGESLKSQVTRRRANQLRNSLAKILVLDKNGMCLELGKHPCIDQVHRSDLGSMDAYNASQYQHPNQINAGTPGSLERVVLSACIMRAGMDLINPAQAVIFKNIKTSFDGRLIQDPAIEEALKILYQRAFTRDPTPLELAELKGMYEEIYKEDPIAAARNWMVLSCFAILTSLEMAFF